MPQVLYGHKCILQDDFSSDAELHGHLQTNRARQQQQDRLTVFNEVRHKVEGYAAQLLTAKYLPRILQWRTHAQHAVLHQRAK